MNGEQFATIGQLRAHGYPVRTLKHARDGIVSITVRRRLTTGVLTLRVYPDGRYISPEYDSRNSGRKIA